MQAIKQKLFGNSSEKMPPMDRDVRRGVPADPRERTRAGLAAARRRGQRLGRPPVHLDLCHALRLRQQGLSARQVAVRLGKSYGVVQRSLRDAQADPRDPGSETSSDYGG